jgi:PPOX class probable F420-dependent enzyme
MSMPVRYAWLDVAMCRQEQLMSFENEDLDLLRLPAFAALALVLPDGSLQNTIMWYRVEEGTLRMIAPAASAKARAMQRSPRVAIAVHDPDNSYDYLEIRGHAEVIADDMAARAELREIAKRYVGERAGAYVDGLSDAPRVLIRVQPERVRRHRSTAPAPTRA